ncbi:MAG: MlaE family lipid ABC transporter permease subunit [Planctomycetes bacterium]|nr:MlaE family lipid ABC transporter permease subunit [Planctomycetota bacterium]
MEIEATRAVRPEGRLDAAAGEELVADVTALARSGAPRLRVDLSAVTALDSRGIAALCRARRCAAERGVPLAVEGASGPVADFLAMARFDELLREPSAPSAGAPREGLLERLGAAALGRAASLRASWDLGLETIYWAAVAPLEGRSGWRWDRLAMELERVGTAGAPIVCLIAFLMGLIMAFQAAAQLRQFGADIFCADLVGVAITRELGPLMAAIVVAGRSGSAIAAELGTMVVGQEVDALVSMGIRPAPYLVVPKVLALAIALPCLAALADLVGVLGGFTIGVGVLGLGPGLYLEQTARAVLPLDVLTGLVKACVFGLIVAMVGCRQGLAVEGGAEGVGRATTSSVVQAIVWIIVADGLFTALFFYL